MRTRVRSFANRFRTLALCTGAISAVLLSVAIGAPRAHAQAAAPSPAASINWGACAPPPSGIPDAGQQCANLSVPLDYHAPSGKKISVAVSRIQSAKPGERRGVLFLNPGGPGGSGLDLPRIFTILFPQSVLDHYDLIGFDPRFVGQSTPLTCGLTAAEASQAFVPLEQSGGFNATASYMKNVADKCTANSNGMLAYATTANTAHDMDQIRQALGEPKISYFAYSYGTYLGAAYASLFPANSDRMVLDSSVDPQWVWRTQFRSWGPGGEQRFPDFTKFAAANDSAYHLGITEAQVSKLFYTLVKKLNANPIMLPDGTILNGAMFREITFGGLYDDANFPATAQVWQLANGQVQPGDVKSALSALLPTQITAARPTAKAAVATPADNAAASGLAILCDDAAWPQTTLQYQIGFTIDSALFPHFGALGSNIWPCAFWQNQAPGVPTPITSNGPRNILMVQDERDPATPYWGALQMRSALGARAGLVSVDQGGHAAAYLKPNTCANDDTTDFLVNGRLPANDRFCPANPVMQPLNATDTVQNAAHQTAVREVLQRMKF